MFQETEPLGPPNVIVPSVKTENWENALQKQVVSTLVRKVQTLKCWPGDLMYRQGVFVASLSPSKQIPEYCMKSHNSNSINMEILV
jgi:hypothetical protein